MIDDRGQRPAPQHGGQDEPVAEDDERLIAVGRIPGERRGRGAEGREEAPRLDQHHRRGDGDERQRDRGAVARRRRQEALRGDLEADEDEDRGDRGLGQHGDQEREHAGRGAGADHKTGSQRVAGSRAHRLVGRMADVGRVLDDPATAPGQHRRGGLGQQDVAGAVLVTRGGGALGVVDPADDRDERERKRDREIG